MNVWWGCRKYQHKYQGLSHAFTCLHHSEDSIKDLSVARCPSVVCRWSGEPCLLLLLLPRSNVSPHFTFTICLCHPSVCPAERWIQNYILHKHYTLDILQTRNLECEQNLKHLNFPHLYVKGKSNQMIHFFQIIFFVLIDEYTNTIRHISSPRELSPLLPQHQREYEYPELRKRMDRLRVRRTDLRKLPGRIRLLK